MRKCIVVGAAITALMVWASGAAAQGTAGEAERAFEEVYAAFSAGYRAGDPASVAALYAPDALYLAPGDEIARGNVTRHFEWLSSFEPGAGPVIEFEVVDREVSGDLGYDVGYYSIRQAEAAPGEGSRGKFIVVWKRGEDGVWRIHADGFSGVDDAGGEAE